MVRLYVGGVPLGVPEEDLAARFRPFGQVLSVEIMRGFAYVDLDAQEAEVARCTKVYSGAKWRGGVLSVQPAKEHYAVRNEVCLTHHT